MSSGFVHSDKGKKESSKHVYSGLGNLISPHTLDRDDPGVIIFDPNTPGRPTDGGGSDGDTDHPNDDGCGILGCGDDDGDSDGGGNDGGDSDGGGDDGGSLCRLLGTCNNDDDGDSDGDGNGNDGDSDDGDGNDGDDGCGILGCRDDDGDSDSGGNDGGSNGDGTQLPVGVDLSAMKAFYNDNKVAVWSGGGVLALLLLLK